MNSKIPIEADQARSELARRFTALVDNDGTMVIATEQVSAGSWSRPGKWDVDEPSPV